MSAEPSESDGAGQSRLQGLAIVATPIGNAADITLRALAVLKSVDAILCEDTRVSAKLLARHGIRRPLLAYHEHNAERMRPRILERLRRGECLALISDAGTPLVSDPGFKLLRAVLAEGLPVTALPRPSAALTALVLSGLPTDRFFFAGFLPPKSAQRRRELTELAAVPGSLVFFEGAQRLPASLADMAAVLGPRPAAVARELTKLFEEVRRAPLDELAAHYGAAGPPLGEVVVVVGPPEAPGETSEAAIDQALAEALPGHSRRDAVDAVASALGLPRRRVYARALARFSEPAAGASREGDGDEG
jgi:16S rRNA (cytidine1402-2'-O)-methyltransferase